MNHVKILLLLYGYIPRLEKDLQRIIKKIGINSMSSHGASVVAAQMIEMIRQRNIILDIKCVIRNLLLKLDEEERMLIDLKYIKNIGYEQIKCFLPYSARTYYRKAQKVFKDIEFYLINHGYTQDWFEKKFGSIKWVKAIENRVERGRINATRETRREERVLSAVSLKNQLSS